MRKGIFITIEGTDGSGKTTQIRRMVSHLTSIGCEVILCREPGSTQISEKIREIILDKENKMMGDTAEMLLYASARAQLISEVIKPAIENGKVVICDRFVDSSYVYQGFARGIPLDTVIEINRIATQGIMPDVTFFFDIAPDVALKRKINRHHAADRIESEKMEFHLKVYEGYKEIKRLYPDRIKSIDAARGIDEIFGDVRKELDSILAGRK